MAKGEQKMLSWGGVDCFLIKADLFIIALQTFRSDKLEVLDI